MNNSTGWPPSADPGAEGEAEDEGDVDGEAETEGEGEIEGETEGEAETDGVCGAEALESAGADAAVCASENRTHTIKINVSTIPLTSQPGLDITSPNRRQVKRAISTH